MNKKIITIDGYVATGKGTTAQGLAKKLWYTYLDTGAMYRAVTFYALEHGLIESSEEAKSQMMSQIVLTFHYNPETDHDDMFLNGKNVEKEIRQTELSLCMKPIVSSPAIRAVLREKQKVFGSFDLPSLQGRIIPKGIVADGRDMGTEVFPDAGHKFFLICDTKVRAQRRYDQLIASGQNADLDAIIQDINQRDDTDYLGANPVSTMADDAIIIDTTDLTIEEQIQKIIDLMN